MGIIVGLCGKIQDKLKDKHNEELSKRLEFVSKLVTEITEISLKPLDNNSVISIEMEQDDFDYINPFFKQNGIELSFRPRTFCMCMDDPFNYCKWAHGTVITVLKVQPTESTLC